MKLEYKNPASSPTRKGKTRMEITAGFPVKIVQTHVHKSAEKSEKKSALKGNFNERSYIEIKTVFPFFLFFVFPNPFFSFVGVLCPVRT